MAVFFALLTLIGWGAGDMFIAIASRKIGSRYAFFWGQVISFLLISLYIPFSVGIADWGMFLFALAIGLADAGSALYYFRAFEVGNASIVGTIGGAFSLVTVIITIVLFGERLMLFQLMGIILAIMGVIILSLDLHLLYKQKFKAIILDPGVKYALIAMLVWGAYFALVRIPVEKIGWFWTVYPTNLFFIVMILTRAVKKDFLSVLAKKDVVLTIIAFSFFITLGMFTYNLGILSGYTSVVAPIAGSSPVLFVILSRIFFREKLSVQQKMGVISSLTGIILISFASA